MSFLNPFLLVGLAAIAIPLIIHFINLRKPERLPFSTISFLEELQKSTIKKIKIKEYLLLAIRILAISLLALGLARPFLSPESVSGIASGNKPIVFSFLVDNSPSMVQIDENGPYLDQAKQLIEKIVNQANDNDRFIIFNTNGELINPNKLSKNSVGNLLKKIKVQNKGDFTEQRLHHIIEMNQKIRNRREIFYWISDGQRTQIDHALGEDDKMGDKTNNEIPLSTYFVQIGSKSNGNVAITKVSIPDKIISYGKKVTVVVNVTNYNDEPTVNQFVSLKTRGKMAGQYEVQLKPHQSKKFAFEVPADVKGYLKGKAVLEGDSYNFDNVRYFSIKIPATKSILLVTPGNITSTTGRKESYLFSALKAAEETNSQITLKRITVDQMSQTKWRNYDAIILNGLQSIPGYLVQDLQNYIQNGHGLVFYPSEKADIHSYNDFLSTMNAGHFKGIRGEYASFKPIAKFHSLSEGHPIFKDIFEKKENEQLKIELPSLYYYLVYQPGEKAGADIILKSNLSEPLLSEQRFGKGVILISSFGTDPGWSNFPANALYAPINYRMALYASSSESGGLADFTLGKTFKWLIPYQSKTVTISLNDEKVRPDVKSTIQGTELTYKGEEWEPGWAEISSGKKKNVIAVNQNIMESDFGTLHNKKLSKILRAHFRNVSLIKRSNLTSNDIDRKINAASFGTEIWNWFVWVGLLLLIIETLISKSLKAETNS